jgi:hypothetical protein
MGTTVWAVAAMMTILSCGCTTAGKPLETHRKGMESITEGEYFAPKKPVDRHYIGYAWSRQFGPVADAGAPDIRVKKDRSLSDVRNERAYNLGIKLGAQTVVGKAGEVGIQGGRSEIAKLQGVEIIGAVSLADIPFEPHVPYVTEALRLANFRIKDEKSAQGGVGMASGGDWGGASASIGGESYASSGTEGEGLVVGYKLHMIDMGTYVSKESGNLPLELDKSIDLPGSALIVKTRLNVIEPGAGKSLPRNLLWSCARAEAMSRNIVAAWLVDIRSSDPGRKSLTVAFPAQPRIDDCQGYSGIISSRIDPATDRITRQKIRLTVVDADVTDSMKPKTWDARVSLTDESFNIRLVRPDDLEPRSK